MAASQDFPINVLTQMTPGKHQVQVEGGGS